MNDDIELIIGNETYTHVTSYRIDSDIYNVAGSFDITLNSSYSNKITTGQLCTVRINGVIVLNGLVERVQMNGGKDSLSYTVSGRDLMGLVVDSCIEEFKTLRNKKLSEVAEYYLRQIDYVKFLEITYLDGAESLDIAQEYVQPVPGMTVFELLSGIAASRGIHFYMKPDGGLVFGRPQGFGSHTFSIYRTNDAHCNYTDFNYTDDLSQRFSHVIVLGQAQSTPTTSVSAINKKAILQDDAFPDFRKPLVLETNTAAETLEQQARMIIEQQRHEGFTVRYTVSGNTQRGNVWTTDAVCAVDDYRIPLQDEFLIYGRTLALSKNEQSTDVVLGKMGVAG